jgi:hypothetical protein
MKLEIIIPAVIVLISTLAYFFVIHSCNKQDNKSYNYFEFTCEDVRGSSSTASATSAPAGPVGPAGPTGPAVSPTSAPAAPSAPAVSVTSAPAAPSAPAVSVTSAPAVSVTSAPSAPTSPGTGGGAGFEMDGQQCVSINQAACDTVGPWTIAGSSTGGGLPTYQNYVSLECGSSSACPVCNECGMPQDNFNRTDCEAALQARCSGSPTLHP